MPHARVRYLRDSIEKGLKFSPIVGILGQRQTGKTTLVSQLASSYVSLDVRDTRERAESDPQTLLMGQSKPFAIDECQLAPALFPALKEFVRQHPGKGQFLLTGSVRFTSRRAIRESLTGRIFNFELLPLSWAESCELPLSELPHHVLTKSSVAVLNYVKQRSRLKFSGTFEAFLKTGGLPGICFHRNEAIRATQFETHLETLLERDLRLLIETTLPYGTLRNLIASLARLQGMPLDISELGRNARVSRPTLRALLRAFESMFLIRTIVAQGGTARPLLLFEDQGMATHLLKGRQEPLIDLWRGLFTNLLPQFAYRSEWNSSFFHYLTRGGASVPIAVESKFGVIGYVPELGRTASVAAIASARSFMKTYARSAVVIAHQGEETVELAPRLYSVPLRLCV